MNSPPPRAQWLAKAASTLSGNFGTSARITTAKSPKSSRSEVRCKGSTTASSRKSLCVLSTDVAAEVPASGMSGRSASERNMDDFANGREPVPPSTISTLSLSSTGTTYSNWSSAGRSSPATTRAVTSVAPGSLNLWRKTKACEAPGTSCPAVRFERRAPSTSTTISSGVTASVPEFLTVTRMPASRSAPTTSRESVTSATARLRTEAGRGRVRHTTCGGLGSWPNRRSMFFQRPVSLGAQPAAWPSPIINICLTPLLPAASVIAAAVSVAGTCMVPAEGFISSSVSRRMRLSEIGVGLSTRGTAPPTMILKAVPRGASPMYLAASPHARSKLLWPSTSIDIEDEPSTTTTISFCAPRPKRRRFRLRSKSTEVITNAITARAPSIQRRRHFG